MSGLSLISATYDTRGGHGHEWQAVCRLPQSWAHLRGVSGASTDSGPWVAGHGPILTEAIEDLHRKLGALALDAFATGRCGEFKEQT